MDNMIQTMCEACEQVLTFPAHEATPLFCLTCTDEIESIHEELTDEDWDAWADEYELEEKAVYYGSLDPNPGRFI